jgi:UDP-glucose 4-epimerase
MKQSVAIVGGLGYLGQALAARLQSDCQQYWIVGRQSPPDILMKGEAYQSSSPHLAPAISGAYTVFHMATLSTPSLGDANPMLDVENIRFTLSLINACKQERVQHLVFLSSGGTVYGESSTPRNEDDATHPCCSHGIGKITCEHYLRLFSLRNGTNVTVLRIGNVYGGSQRAKGGQGVVGYLKERLIKGQTVHLYGNTVRDYVYIGDVIEAFLQTLKNPKGFRLYNIGTGVGTELIALATMAAEILLIKPSLEIADRRPYDLAYNVLNCTRANEELGWIANTPLREGLIKYLRPDLLIS